MSAGQVLCQLSHGRHAQGQFQATPSALRMVPDPSEALGNTLLANSGLQVKLLLNWSWLLPALVCR